MLCKKTKATSSYLSSSVSLAASRCGVGVIFIAAAADSLYHFTDGCSGSPLCPGSLWNHRSFTYLCNTMLPHFRCTFLSSCLILYLEDVVPYIKNRLWADAGVPSK